MRILVVEDERRMAELLRQGLTEDGHVVTVALEGREGLSVAGSGEFDLLILDVMLPGVSGFEIARQLRARRNQTPILILTARDSTRDVVEGLDAGADDYLTKPFSFEVLLARLRSISRRGSAPRPTVLKVGDLMLDPASHEVRRGGEVIHLSPTEFRLLEFLMRRAGRVVSRNTIVQAIWNFD